MPRSHAARPATICAAPFVTCLLAFVGPVEPAAACIQEDLDASGAVDGADLGLLLAQWGPAAKHTAADLNGDGVVDAADLGLLLAAWGDVPPVACLGISGVSPSSGTVGAEITLAGTFPDPDLLDYSLIAKSADGVVVPFEVTGLSPDSLTARIGPYPAGTTSATFVIALGCGNPVPVDRLPAGFEYSTDPVWVWTWESGPVASSVEFHFDAPAAPIDGTFFGSISESGLVVAVNGDCAANTAFDIWIHARHEPSGANDPFAAVALHIPQAKLQQRRDALTCAEALCNLINSVYLAQSPNPIKGDCTVQITADGFILGSYVDEIDVNSGAFIVQGTGG
ncbi:MAG: hypothetical protein U0575_06600 [Phycisphaerales bacterium]